MPLLSITKSQGSVGRPKASTWGRLFFERGVVVLEDLHVDEGRLVAVELLDLLGDVDDRAADAAHAELRGREEQDDRFLAEGVGVVDLVLGVGRDPGGDLGEVAADVGGGRRVDQRGLLADPGDTRRAADDRARQQGPLELVAFLDQRRDPPLAVAREVDVGRVDGLGGARVFARGQGAEAGWVSSDSIRAGNGPGAGTSRASASLAPFGTLAK